MQRWVASFFLAAPALVLTSYSTNKFFKTQKGSFIIEIVVLEKKL
jgi:hypothetical protein